MDAAKREDVERELRRLWDTSDFSATATVALRELGPEIYGFLFSFHRNEGDAADVFSAFAERLWRGLPQFEWACSFRTWAYTIARNASRSHRSDARRRAHRFGPLPEDSELSAIVATARTATKSYLKSEVKNRIAELRDSLPEADRMLLSLRIDRELSWLELAQVLHDGDEPLAGPDLTKESARLRKRFQLAKEKLTELGVREGFTPKADRVR